MPFSPRLLVRMVPLLVVLVLAGLQLWHKSSPSTSSPSGTVSVPHSAPTPGTAPVRVSPDPGPINAALRAAARAHASEVEVDASGRVTRLLPDDTKGSPHQRWLVRVGDSLTILVAHNLDLAPRVPLQTGDSVLLRGEYVWNPRGGMTHWTHHDPANQHRPGWVEYRGRRYE